MRAGPAPPGQLWALHKNSVGGGQGRKNGVRFKLKIENFIFEF
jgi:hypothetical protein